MNLWESFYTSLDALAHNKMRSGLTMLGIVIGVAAVVALSALGQGVQAMVSNQIEGIGSNMIFVQAYTPKGASSPAQLTMRDAEALADPFNAPDVVAVAPQKSGQVLVSRKDNRATFSVTATTAELASIRNIELALGGFITAADVRDRTSVAVLGADVYKELFDTDEYPIDKFITIEGTRFRVVGVLKAEGGMMSADNSIYVPITTAQARLFTQRTLSGDYPLSSITVATKGPDQAKAAANQITATLRERRQIRSGKEDDFRVTSQEAILDMTGQITGILTLFLGVIAGISLLVGGIGIMNVMLMTVTERTREIGIRKAIGATNVAIMSQFMIEALVLTLGGGALGMGLGYAGSNLASTLMNVTASVTPEIVLLATGVSTLTGLVFGVYPAMRAAQLRPIEALRYE